jgi:hypothetical protein
MKRVVRLALVTSAALLAVTTAAGAQPDPTTPTEPAKPEEAAPAPAPEEATSPEEEAAAEPEEELDYDDKTVQLEAKIDELETRLTTTEESRKSRFPVTLSGYGDIGLFGTQGDGAGIRRDIGHEMFPEHSDIGWVFYGDLLGTQVNSRGDVADVGEVPGVDRFDSVNSEGHVTFLVNELNLTVNAGLGSQALFTSSVNFTPRTGSDFRLGDSFDVDLVQVEWMPTSDGNTSIFAGKVDSVVGVEYKRRKAINRFGITPSLLARYTSGTAVGLKARSRLLGEHLVLAAAITNGSFGAEQFHFFNEVDSNTFKTVSGRAAVRLPFGSGGFEAGPSGQWGTQDGAPDDADGMWFVGVDAELEISRVRLEAQWLKGKAPGDEVTMAYSLDLKQGAYVEGDVIVTPLIGIIGRAEFRNAEIQQGTERLYITKNWRTTGGVRFIFNPKAIVKAEYSHTGAYGGTPSIPDDVVTTSAVMAF